MQQFSEQCHHRPRLRPAADLVEREDGFYLYLDVPGVQKDDLTVDIEESELSVEAISSIGVCGGERVHAMEFGDVEYHARFTLADTVDRQRIGAQLENGVLTIFMPKREEEMPTRIKIEVL